MIVAQALAFIITVTVTTPTDRAHLVYGQSAAQPQVYESLDECNAALVSDAFSAQFDALKKQFADHQIPAEFLAKCDDVTALDKPVAK